MTKAVRKLTQAGKVAHIKDLVPDSANRRKHNPRNIGMVVDALHQLGAARSIVIDEDNVILAGNGVTEAAAEAGITRVRVIEASGEEIIAVRRSGLTEAQKRALAIYDNRTAELAEWNPEQLRADQAAGLDLKPWFSDEELARIVGATEARGGLTDPDAVPDQRPTDIGTGDLFELGRHRLLCGDCTKPNDLARLMGARLAQCVFTDPPYGVSYVGGLNESEREKIAGDEAPSLYRPALQATADFCDRTAPAYLWFAGSQGADVYAAVESSGMSVRALIVWNKVDPHYGNFMAQYMQKHEPCLYCIRSSPPWFGPTNEVTVWDVKQPSRNELHPTQKPVELAIRALNNSTAVGAIVADWFLGSGSTMIAAEQIGRACYGVEVEPLYCQVIIDRWEAFTGQKAVKLGEVIPA